jgi:DNA/RNA endonuclease YhcR with UshA esterase domain
MKTLILFLLLSRFAFAQIPSDSAKYHIGKKITVCGKVVGAFTTKTGVTMLNFDKAYPMCEFTAVIFKGDSMNFEKGDFYKGKRICVTGMVKKFNGNAEIVLKKANQIRFPEQ